MTITEAGKNISQAIRHIYEESEALNIAEMLMEHVTNQSRIELAMNKNYLLSDAQLKLLNESVARLQKHEPIQYIIHESWFANMKFYVDQNVLIPRPETEELADWIIKELRNKPEVRILDIGTGSGCIAIALKKNLPDSEIWGCDISEEALNIARMNADALDTTIDFVVLDFLDKPQQEQLPSVDIIVSNPPYVTQAEKKEMRQNVTDYEPAAALFVPDNDPLIFYKAIAGFGKEKLNANGKIYVEINETLGEQVKNLFITNGYKSAELKKDMQEKSRMIKITL
jgi:release factor glutamine methyltransferase